ncbi:MAG: MGMT family protein [Clostridiales bacterium]|nr:MGMT family protein [Clostridiales bacterium]
MVYTYSCASPLGEITLAGDEHALMGLWFVGQKYYADNLGKSAKGSREERLLPILKGIPYGQTMTYGEIAARIAQQRGLKKMSAQAVGGAVGRNPISIIVPCHRVVGTNGSLTGYAGGIDKKMELLRLEGVDIHRL